MARRLGRGEILAQYFPNRLHVFIYKRWISSAATTVADDIGFCVSEVKRK